MKLPAFLPDDDAGMSADDYGRVQQLFARYDRLSDSDLGRAIDAIMSGMEIGKIAESVGLGIAELRRNLRSVGVNHA